MMLSYEGIKAKMEFDHYLETFNGGQFLFTKGVSNSLIQEAILRGLDVSLIPDTFSECCEGKAYGSGYLSHGYLQLGSGWGYGDTVGGFRGNGNGAGVGNGRGFYDYPYVSDYTIHEGNGSGGGFGPGRGSDKGNGHTNW